jgi:hypothetical protein
MGCAHRCRPAFPSILGAGAASANDGSGERAVGGTVTLMGSNPTIRLVSEDIFVRLPECAVETRFVFRNEGPPTSVLMIFPENGYLNGPPDERRRQHRSGGVWKPGPRALHALRLLPLVRGRRPAKVTRRVQNRPNGDSPYYRYWWDQASAPSAGGRRGGSSTSTRAVWAGTQ